jgi:8-oxo-dGTP diphosphatase
MFYRRGVLRIISEKIDGFNEYFHDYLLPIQLTNGAKLIGRWITEDQHERDW